MDELFSTNIYKVSYVKNIGFVIIMPLLLAVILYGINIPFKNILCPVIFIISVYYLFSLIKDSYIELCDSEKKIIISRRKEKHINYDDILNVELKDPKEAPYRKGAVINTLNDVYDIDHTYKNIDELLERLVLISKNNNCTTKETLEDKKNSYYEELFKQ